MKSLIAFVLVVLAAVWLMNRPARSEPPAAGSGTAGKETYVMHCASCHGADGRGDGPRASSLKTAPADLTGLAARNKGEFPSARVADVIRNGGALLGHAAEMPAWSNVFGVKGDPSIARTRVNGLVQYLKTLQAK